MSTAPIYVVVSADDLNGAIEYLQAEIEQERQSAREADGGGC